MGEAEKLGESCGLHVIVIDHQEGPLTHFCMARIER